MRRSSALHPEEARFPGQAAEAAFFTGRGQPEALARTCQERRCASSRRAPGGLGRLRRWVPRHVWLCRFHRCSQTGGPVGLPLMGRRCEWKLLDSSRSTTPSPTRNADRWAPLFAVASELAHPMSVHALDTVARSSRGVYFLLGPDRKAQAGIVGLGIMDLYATLTTTYQFLSREPRARLSRASFQFSKVWSRSGVSTAAEPMPIFTAVRVAPQDAPGVRPHTDSSLSKVNLRSARSPSTSRRLPRRLLTTSASAVVGASAWC